jgi:hypothetical protein
MVGLNSPSLVASVFLVASCSVFTPNVSAQTALNPCPTDQNEKYDNCYGEFVHSSGARYRGEFKNDQFNGWGMVTIPNSGIYIGQFKDNAFQGDGVYTMNDGTKYAGKFSNDQANGYGTFILANGDKYVGQYTDWKLNGQSYVSYVNGDFFVGFYKDSRRDGYGVYNWNDGSKFEGKWRDGVPTSDGTLSDKNGEVLVGAEYVNQATYASEGHINSSDVLTYTDGSPSISIESASTKLGSATVLDKTVELFDDRSWRYMRDECATVVLEKIYFCGDDNKWRRRAEVTNAAAAAQFDNDDRNVGMMVYEKVGEEEGLDYRAMRNAILEYSSEEADKNNEPLKIIEDGTTTIWGNEKVGRLVLANRFDGIKIVVANTYVNRKNDNLQIITIFPGEAWNEAARKLHEDFVRGTTFD